MSARPTTAIPTPPLLAVERKRLRKTGDLVTRAMFKAGVGRVDDPDWRLVLGQLIDEVITTAAVGTSRKPKGDKVSPEVVRARRAALALLRRHTTRRSHG